MVAFTNNDKTDGFELQGIIGKWVKGARSVLRKHFRFISSF
jgi:hypothetical protein